MLEKWASLISLVLDAVALNWVIQQRTAEIEKKINRKHRHTSRQKESERSALYTMPMYGVLW